jgi:hypothetical protein
MNNKLILKIMVLLLAFVLVLFFRQQMGSQSFQGFISTMFGSSKPSNNLSWCADHVVDFVWISAEVPEKLKSMKMSELIKNFCSIPTEPITDIDLTKIDWSLLAESAGATGQKTTLEWNQPQNLFRSGGMPFKSSHFTQELAP